MLKPTTLVLLTLFSVTNSLASDINLSCDDMAFRLARQLSTEGLIKNNAIIIERTKSIALNECRKAESTAGEQLEKSKQDWVQNWLFENTGGKPGNERLKRLKR